MKAGMVSAGNIVVNSQLGVPDFHLKLAKYPRLHQVRLGVPTSSAHLEPQRRLDAMPKNIKLGFSTQENIIILGRKTYIGST